jgi:hypothetical protein
MAIATLEDLFTTYNADITATDTEIAAWKTLEPVQRTYKEALSSGRLSAAVDNKVTTSVGLFGADLTKFNEDCVALDTLCKVADYEAYNGWGVGVNWTSTAADGAVDAQVDGVVFTDSKWTVQVTWDDTADTNVVKSAIAKVAPSATTPDDGDVTLAVADDAFEAWAAEAGNTEADQFTFAFFEADDEDFYFEAGETEDVWATFGAVADVEENVKTTAFEFVGAASLTAATSVIVAALLF